MDITNRSVNRVAEVNPWAVVNAAGYVRRMQSGNRICAVNADGAAVLAAACLEQEIGLVTFSSDLVFEVCCSLRGK